MKLYSWNVNGLRAVEKKGSLKSFIESELPDIICFQEIKMQQDQLTDQDFDQKYPSYHKFYSFAKRKGYSGTAIWSKEKPLQFFNNFTTDVLQKYNLADSFGDASTEGRISVAEFKEFWLISVYTPNSKGDLGRLKLRREWDKAFLEFVQNLEKGKALGESGEFLNAKPVIFAGDLNVAHQEIDLANPKQNKGEHGFTDEERAGFDNFIEYGFVDVFREQHLDQPNLYTWWSYYQKSRERNVGWRIDYFVVSKILTKKLNFESYIHPSVMGSDHCPVSIKIDNKLV